jgi:hypothetical protein
MPATDCHAVFLETPDGTVVVALARPEELADPDASMRACRRLSQALGGLPVVQRCAAGHALLFGGPVHLRRYAADPAVDHLPAVMISRRPPLADAA